MSAVQYVNSNADIVRKAQSAAVNINAARGLQEVLKTNLGPKGTIKMLVGGAGQIKLTKDGNVLLHEMQIQHPTAAMIGRAATAQDDIVGDGTTSNVLFIGELLNQSERCLSEGVHPRVLAEGFDIARQYALNFLEKFKIEKDVTDKELLNSVARTSLRTKVHPDLANQLTPLLTEAVLTIKKENTPIDLFMIEIMHMKHRTESDTRLVRGLVLDHGCRHAGMPHKLENCFILTCNVSLEYEKTEINSIFTYNNAADKDKLVEAERRFTDEKVRKIIEFKRKVCEGNDKNFVVINQKGIDPISLDMLAKENIMALRRAKRRNMERLVEACGGVAVNSVEDLTESDLGFAGEVFEQTLGEDKYTFVEGVQNPTSCTLLIKGPTEHSIAQTKEAIRDGLRSVKNTIEDAGVVPGAGAFEVALSESLLEHSKQVSGKAKLGVQAFANALLVIPKTLASNSGLDTQEVLLKVIEEHQKTGNAVGVDVETGDPNSPEVEGILDNYCVKQQFLNLAPVLAQQLLLVDEIIRAGKKMGKQEE